MSTLFNASQAFSDLSSRTGESLARAASPAVQQAIEALYPALDGEARAAIYSVLHVTSAGNCTAVGLSSSRSVPTPGLAVTLSQAAVLLAMLPNVIKSVNSSLAAISFVNSEFTKDSTIKQHGLVVVIGEGDAPWSVVQEQLTARETRFSQRGWGARPAPSSSAPAATAPAPANTGDIDA